MGGQESVHRQVPLGHGVGSACGFLPLAPVAQPGSELKSSTHKRVESSLRGAKSKKATFPATWEMLGEQAHHMCSSTGCRHRRGAPLVS